MQYRKNNQLVLVVVVDRAMGIVFIRFVDRHTDDDKIGTATV